MASMAASSALLEVSIPIVAFALFLVVVSLVFIAFNYVTRRVLFRLTSLRENNFPAVAGVVVALLIFPNVALYFWRLFISLLQFVSQWMGEIISSFAGEDLACKGSSDGCDFGMAIARNLASEANKLVDTISRVEFPATEFILFLIVTTIVTYIIRYFVQIRTYIGQVNPLFKQRLALLGVFLLSIYLAIGSLLAISLFHDKPNIQTMTAEALDKILTPNLIATEDFTKAYPDFGEPKYRKPQNFQIADINNQGRLNSVFQRNEETLTNAFGRLSDEWTNIRDGAKEKQKSLTEQAMVSFSTGLEVGVGRKQTAIHYNDLYVWHQHGTQKIRTQLNECHAKINQFRGSFVKMLDDAAGTIENVSGVREIDDAARNIGDQVNRTYPEYRDAESACELVSLDNYEELPSRKGFVAILGPLGVWFGWLLNTEQMPVVIIVGLIGFSLMGATVSRAVRASSQGKGAMSFTLDDVFLVFGVGMTAAIIIFLAAYGGLAVIGSNSGEDPNPYVLFATCLIAAVYSEDVWNWARGQLSSRLQPEFLIRSVTPTTLMRDERQHR